MRSFAEEFKGRRTPLIAGYFNVRAKTPRIGVIMENLKVPYGMNDSGELVSSENAVKTEAYRCPSCNVKLIHRAGEIRAKHFAHPPESECSLESILHKVAKQLTHNAIIDNSTGNMPILLRNHCHSCGVEFDAKLPPKTFSGAALEVGVSDYVCDVVGYRESEIALAVEIFNTHKVGDKKASDLPVHWVELKAEEVIDNPFYWKPTQSHLKRGFCPSCKSHIKHVYEVADKWNIDRHIYSPIKNPSSFTYIASTETCFKCKEEIPVFWWQGVPFCEAEPPQPRPRTIKYRNSKQYGGAYWANTCANCNMIQGDNYLFLFDNAPLKGLPLANEENSNHSGGVRVISGDSAVSEFMKVINRNF